MNKMFIQPDWPAPPQIRAYTTLRSGGVSQTPFDQFNLAEHVGDDPAVVFENRSILKETLQLPAEPIWVDQIHSTIALEATLENRNRQADASYTDNPNQVCIILTADCLPILVCDKKGTKVAAIHAGWRGLLNGIISTTLQQLQQDSDEELLIWLGPAISQANYEVGEEVRTLFLKANPEAETAFTPSSNSKWLADLYALAKVQLNKMGHSSIYGGSFCTYGDKEKFYSYRRDGGKTGRMATLIWISH